MDNHSRRFVDHNYIIIFKYNLKRDRLGQRFQFSRFIQLQIQHLPLFHTQRWVGNHNTVKPHSPTGYHFHQS